MKEILKKWLKKIKFNEATISAVLGVLVVLTVGVLILNYFKSNKAGKILNGQEANQLNQQPAPEDTSQTKIHKVALAESLWSISEKYYQDGYRWVDIAKENNLAAPDLLAMEQELKLPTISKKELPAEAGDQAQTSKQSENTILSIDGDSYQVQQGDSLWQIAIRAYGDGYKWSEIAKNNNLVNPDYIEIGQEIKLLR